MRLSPHEEYGLRCLLEVARAAPVGADEPVSIERIATREGIGYEHAAKTLRFLRRGGLVSSSRGVNGGYRLARQPEGISVWEVLVALDPPLVDPSFCEAYAGQLDACTHGSASCKLRALWTHVGRVLESGLREITVADLLRGDLPTLRTTDGVPAGTMERA